MDSDLCHKRRILHNMYQTSVSIVGELSVTMMHCTRNGKTAGGGCQKPNLISFHHVFPLKYCMLKNIFNLVIKYMQYTNLFSFLDTMMYV